MDSKEMKNYSTTTSTSVAARSINGSLVTNLETSGQRPCDDLEGLSEFI